MGRANSRWLIPSCCAAFGLCLLAGCQQENARDYQTFEQKRQSGSEFPTSFPNDVADSEHEPLPAEIEESGYEFPVDALAPVNLVDSSNVGEILRVAKPDAEGQGFASVLATTGAAVEKSAAPRKLELLVKTREFRAEGTHKALRVNFDDLDLLKVLNMDPVTPNAVELMPDWQRRLDGQTIRLRGFMFPTFESTGIERFVLARDAEKCCFGPNAKVYDLIAVEMKAGKTCDYIHLRPFDVVGKLRIEMQADDDLVLGLYRIEDAELVQK